MLASRGAENDTLAPISGTRAVSQSPNERSLSNSGLPRKLLSALLNTTSRFAIARRNPVPSNRAAELQVEREPVGQYPAVRVHQGASRPVTRDAQHISPVVRACDHRPARLTRPSERLAEVSENALPDDPGWDDALQHPLGEPGRSWFSAHFVPRARIEPRPLDKLFRASRETRTENRSEQPTEEEASAPPA